MLSEFINSKYVVLNHNKKNFKFNIEFQWLAGISLTGVEVRSVRKKCVQLEDSYILIKKNTVVIYDLNFQFSRKRHILLLTKCQISKITKLIKKRKMFLVALSIGFVNGLIKLNLGLVLKKKTIFKKRHKVDFGEKFF